jgi:DJ-1/PfpI family
MKIGVLVADGFQDSEYFLPKIEIEKVGVATEVISLTRAPVEISSFFTRIGLLDVQKTVDEADPADYTGVLVPGGAKSPAILSESEAALRFLREINGQHKDGVDSLLVDINAEGPNDFRLGKGLRSGLRRRVVCITGKERQEHKHHWQ